MITTTRIIFVTFVLLALFALGVGLSVGNGSNAIWIAWVIFTYAMSFGASFAVMGVGVGIFIRCVLFLIKPREADPYGEWGE